MAQAAIKGAASQAVCERVGKVSQKLRIEVRAEFDIRAKRVQHSRVGLGAIHHGGDKVLVELRFGQNTGDPFVSDTALNFGDAGGAGV